MSTLITVPPASTSGFVLKSGDTMTGALVLSPTAASSTAETVNTGDPTSKGLIVKAALSNPAGVQPDSVAGLTLWFKADAITGLSDGAAVSTWTDSSANVNSATQASGSLQPLYKTNILNGNPVVRFDGSNDTLATGSNTGLTGNQAMTAFAVFKSTATSGDYPAIFSQNPGTTDLGVSLTLNGNRPGLDFWVDRWRVTTALNNTSFYIISAVKVAGVISPNTSIYNNETLAAGAVEGSNNTPNITNNVMKLGTLDGTGGRFFAGDVAEIIIYNVALSATDQQNIENYLSIKYAIAGARSTSQSADLLEVQAANTSLLAVIDSSGNFGLGVSAPSNIVHVLPPVGSPARVRLQQSGATSADYSDYAHFDSTGIQMASIFVNSTAKTDYGGAKSLNIININSAPITLGILNAIKVTLDTSGRMGVGVTSPTAFVHAAASTTAIASMRTPAGTAPTSPNEGEFWNDSTQKSMIFYASAIKQSMVGTIFTQTADATVTNTVTETSIIGAGVGTLTLPANFFTAGKSIRIRIGGIYSTPLAATPSVIVKIKYGSTVLASATTTSLLSGASGLEFEGQATITCRTTGSSGTVVAHGAIEYGTGIAGQNSIDALNNGGAATTINTTTSNAIDCTITWDSATNTRSATSFVTTAEVLN